MSTRIPAVELTTEGGGIVAIGSPVDFDTVTATPELRFVNGRLQQKFCISSLSAYHFEWREVPSVEPNSTGEG